MTAPGPLPYPNADAPPEDLIARCVHCGFCLPTCPTFAVLGVEMDSPRGRIRLMKTVWEHRLGADADGFEDHIGKCLDCRACETACPSGVEYGKLVEGARSQIVAARPRSPLERLIRAAAFDWLLPHRRALGAFATLSIMAKRLGVPAALRATRLRIGRRLADLLDLLPDRASAAALTVVPARGERRARVALLSGCVMGSVFATTNAATARVLARNGVEVVAPADQTCCGALHAHAGERERARALARRNIVAFARADVDAIVVNAAGCGAAMKEYGWLLKDDGEWSARASAFASKVRDSTEYLAEIGVREPPGPVVARATWDDPCHLLHGQKVREQPRALLAAIPDLDLVPLDEADWCCGSAGTYNVTQPDLARSVLDRKVANILKTGAELVVTANPGCLMQMQAGLRAARAGVTVVHLMDLLDRAYGGAEV
ncbi:MAG TPA: heterodisulfide reductase-related iron-sulfur binding cluster [Candidatus Limnocylindria bacterium]|nr:heterodisulfide reductase-related iron-sulfur binding cluster [Candidatus Limnocylindria bacterium]